MSLPSIPPHFLHGGDYSPEQWQPEDWRKDIALLKRAGGNLLTVGVFSWVRMEPREGLFEFDWLDEFIDLAEQEGIFISLSTPTASPPLWMGHRYPEILRVAEDGERFAPGMRVNVCHTSPVYREKSALINRELSRRYGQRKHVVWWHVSNEYCFHCYCDLCQSAFRKWLQRRHGTLRALNQRWNTAFWGHTYMSWNEIIAPGGKREISCEALWVEWKRFYSAQVVDFMQHEILALRAEGSSLPATTNFMAAHEPLDYSRFIPAIDFVSLDSYPSYHDRADNWITAANQSLHYDMMRAFKRGQPWILMESSPSSANWMPVMKLKRPGVHRQECLQAVAHGADAVLYFQVKKSLGGREKLHGAVIDHTASADSRVFREVAEVGQLLETLQPVHGTTTKAEVAVIFDWENRWAIDACCGPRKEGKDYLETCQAHYRAFWSQGISVDVVSSEADFTGYRLVVAPMLYMVKPGVAQALEKFAEAGGCVVGTYWSGLADENDLIFPGGHPGPLRQLFGIRSEEIDALYDDESNTLVAETDLLPYGARYEARIFCDLIHAETAEVLARYGQDFYSGRPALTRNTFGQGSAYYIATRTGPDFLQDFYTSLSARLGLRRALPSSLPVGVSAQRRGDFLFLFNYDREPRTISLAPHHWTDALTFEAASASVTLEAYGSRVFRHSAL